MDYVKPADVAAAMVNAGRTKLALSATDLVVRGGLAGGGAGTALGAFTGNRDIEIPAESIVKFKLENTLVLQQ